MMRTGRPIAIALLCLLALLAVRAPGLTDYTASAEKKKTILEHADTIEGGETPESSGKVEPFRSATGSVVFIQGSKTLRCDHAVEYPESDRIILEGNISIKDKTLETFGDKGIYYPDEEVGELSGNVRGRVVKDSLVAKSNRSVFNQKTDELWLYDDAIAWHQGRQLSGDIIRVHMKEVGGDKKVDEIQVHGHAFFTVKDTLSTGRQLFDQMSGEHMVVKLDDRSRLTGVTVTKRAKSLYHIYDDENQPSGVNFTSGDVMQMFFREGKLSRILTTGSSLGKQYPNSLREDKGIDLPEFRWRESEKPAFK
jgi:lipopolysaccharide export system protein LptA